MRFELNISQHSAELYSLFIGYNFQFAMTIVRVDFTTSKENY